MAIVQRDEIALSQSRLSQRSQSDMISGKSDRNSSETEGKLLNVEGEVCIGIQCWRLGYFRWGRPVFLSFSYGQTV